MKLETFQSTGLLDVRFEWNFGLCVFARVGCIGLGLVCDRFVFFGILWFADVGILAFRYVGLFSFRLLCLVLV